MPRGAKDGSQRLLPHLVTGFSQQIAREAYAQTESNLYAISPEKSHVSKDLAAGDSEFWTPKFNQPPSHLLRTVKEASQNLKVGVLENSLRRGMRVQWN